MNISLPLIDIVLPCYNPHDDWEKVVKENFNEIANRLIDKATVNLIIVNDGSKINVEEKNIQMLKNNISSLIFISYSKNMGKGFALRKGIAESRGDYCIYTDIDFPYTTESFLSVANCLVSKEADIAAGIRTEIYYNNMPVSRVRISKFLKNIIARTLRLRLSDTQCGLKGFNDSGRNIFLRTSINRYLFDMEFIYIASSIPGIRLQPVTVFLRENIIFSKMNTKILLTEGFNFIKIFVRSIFRKR